VRGVEQLAVPEAAHGALGVVGPEDEFPEAPLVEPDL
jgi:hypothetical protein